MSEQQGAKCECICGCEVIAMKPDCIPYLCSVCRIREMRGDGEFHHLRKPCASTSDPEQWPAVFSLTFASVAEREKGEKLLKAANELAKTVHVYLDCSCHEGDCHSVDMRQALKLWLEAMQP